MKTVIIGLGNPILRDDGVGIQVVRRLRKEFADSGDTEFLELSVGGFRLMEAMVGYQRSIIVDAMVTDQHEPGTLREFTLQTLVSTKNTCCSHDSSLKHAFEAGETLGLSLPTMVRILGIEAKDIVTFGEDLTPAVEAAIPRAIEKIRSFMNERGNDA